MPFAISVDVAAAVRALTERTRPSLAFDVVRVVRRALALGATRVDVRCDAARFVVRWQGPPADAAELDLVQRVLAAHAPDDDERAALLLTLEERYSLALLALFATAARAELHGPAPLAAERGRVVAPPARGSKSAIVVVRAGDAAMAREERRELARWCRHADAPVIVNGRRIDRPFKLPGARGTRIVRGPLGRALIGLADDPRASRVVVYSYGVYVGVRPRPRGSMPITALVSVRGFGPEDDTRAAMRAADEVVAAAEARLSQAVAHHFAAMPRSERQAIRDALLDGEPRSLAPPLDDAPLFDAVGAPFSLSLADLARAARTGALPAAAHPAGHLPGTPLLDARARAFVTRALGDVVRPALPAPRAWWARLTGAPRLLLE